MNRLWTKVGVAFLGGLALHLPAQAQTEPTIPAGLQNALGMLPVPGIKDAMGDMVDALKKTACGNGIAGCYTAKKTVAGVPLQLYFYSRAAQQSFLLVVNSRVALPNSFNKNTFNLLNGTQVSDAIFSVSTADFALSAKDMPADLKAIVTSSYFGVESLNFVSGIQMTSHASIKGPLGPVIHTVMGVPVQDFTVRAGVVLPIPVDLTSGASLAASLPLNDLEKLKSAGKDLPEGFFEFQLAPGKTIQGGLGMNQGVELTDATLYATNLGVVGYKGNVTVPGSKRKFITFFEMPVLPSGAADLLNVKFGLAAKILTLEDYANVAISMATPQAPGGSFVKDIKRYEDKIYLATKPLSVFKLKNPEAMPAEYKFGDPTKPFPATKAFNILLLGPLANEGGTSGPLLRVFDDVVVLGQKIGKMKVIVGTGGLRGDVSADLMFKMGPLGKLGVRMATHVEINQDRQKVQMIGNVLGRVLEVNLNGASVAVRSPATCATPFEISIDAQITAETDDGGLDLAKLLDASAGANVDPSKLQGCIGEDLKKALTWVSTTGSALGGYTAGEANKALNKIAADAAAAAQVEYNKAKDAARNLANSSTNEANQAFKSMGNAFKGMGKKKHKGGPDKRLDPTVFDWDYYYDTRGTAWGSTDLVTHWRNGGFDEGRRGSYEFDINFYKQHNGLNGSNANILNHWLGDGINQCLQASPEFSLQALKNRYPGSNCRDTLNWWIESGGMDSGLNGKP